MIYGVAFNSGRNINPKPNPKMRNLIILSLGILALTMVSCNVTRTITTQSQYYQHGDTSVVIQTKTVETYDASKK